MNLNDKIQAYKDSLPLMQDLVPDLGPEKNGECHGGCPSCGSTAGSDRFWVSTTGKYAGKCKCRMEGCAFSKGADIIDYIEITTGADLTTQMREAGFLDDESAQPRRAKSVSSGPAKKESAAGPGQDNSEENPPSLPATKKKNTASFIWNKSKASDKIPYEYLEKTRKLRLEQNSEIRFNSYVDKEKILHEMIVLRLSRPGDDLAEPQSIQRTFIKKEDDPDSDNYGLWVKTGSAICNSNDRAAVGRGVWFCPGMPIKEIAVGEGPETMISVGLATGMNYVSCLTDSGIKNIQFPKETEDVYFFVDQDCKLGKHGGPGFAGQKSGLAAARRAEKQGKRAFIVTPTEDTFSDDPDKVDFNNLYKADPTGQSIRDRLARAYPVGDIDWKPPKKKRNAEAGEYPEGTLELLEKLNGEYAACLVSGKFRISREFVSETRGFHTVEFLEVGSFKNFLANKKCKVFVGEFGQTKKSGRADVWMEWDVRKSYKTVVFDPSNSISKDAYNLWRGFAVKPIKGNWDLFRGHMFQVLCDENQIHFDYLMAWMARIVQKPGGKRPGVAVVLQGYKGAGKGTFFHGFGKLFGESYVHVSTKKGVTGDFNMHLSKGVLLFADEATWAGDNEAEGRLKAMISEPTLDFEPKGIDRIPMVCHINMGIACNDEWAVNATEDERRYFVLKLLKKAFCTTEYFAAIWEELENGGYEAMMYDLLAHDFSDIDLRKAPVTDGLISQIAESLSKPLEFWHEVLDRGFLLSDIHSGAPVESKRGLGKVSWPESVWKYELVHEFKSIFERKVRYPDKEQTFWKETRKFWDVKETQPLNNEKKRQRAIMIPDIDDLRDMFTAHTGITFSEKDTLAAPVPF